jgi:hypothetical protein
VNAGRDVTAVTRGGGRANGELKARRDMTARPLFLLRFRRCAFGALKAMHDVTTGVTRGRVCQTKPGIHVTGDRPPPLLSEVLLVCQEMQESHRCCDHQRN